MSVVRGRKTKPLRRTMPSLPQLARELRHPAVRYVLLALTATGWMALGATAPTYVVTTLAVIAWHPKNPSRTRRNR